MRRIIVCLGFTLNLVIHLGATSALACHRAGDLGKTVNTTTHIRVEPSGITHYEFKGWCHTAPTGQPTQGDTYEAIAIWDPSKRVATERLSGPGSWHHNWTDGQTTWSCPTDPWLTRLVICNLMTNTLKPAVPSLANYPPDSRPFSAWSLDVQDMRKRYQAALPPAPALPPRNTSASVYQQLVRVSWTLPADHTNLHPIVGWFRVERRPVVNPPIAWFAASSNLAVARTFYDDPDPAKTKTEYRVCAVNISGANCSAGIVPVGAALSSVGSAAITQGPAVNTKVLQQAANPNTKSMSNQCLQGFVWRVANPNDLVCVTPESRSRVAQENATAASRVNPQGAYGPNTCIAGYVWREAFQGDLVCVTPQVRTLVRQENELAANRKQ